MAGPKTIKGGVLIVFDGIDGVGKTTQLNLAKAVLESDGFTPHQSRNLGGTPIGEELRQVMLSKLARPANTNLYISAAIQTALVEAITKERQADKLILMDRGPLSLAAYEVYGSGVDESLALPHVEDGMKQLRPELTIIYDADVKTAVNRARLKSGLTDYFESKPDSYFERVAEGYHKLAERYQSSTILIDANQTIEAVHEQTMLAIRGELGTRLF